MTEEEKRIYAEQTWFATTTGALNGLLLNGMKSIASSSAVMCVKLLSLLISAYAVFLVLQRSADAEGEIKKNKVDGVPGEESEDVAVWRAARRERVWQETWRNFRVVGHHIPFVLRQFSGALFYVLLIMVSCFAVMCASHATAP